MATSTLPSNPRSYRNRTHLVTDATVFGPGTGRLDVAQVAASILDDVRVLVAVELGHNAIGALPAQLLVGRIDEQGGQVGDGVHDVEAGEEAEHGLLQGRLEGGHEHQVGAQPKAEQRYPADQLERMQRQLEPVNATAATKIRCVHIILEGATWWIVATAGEQRRRRQLLCWAAVPRRRIL